MTWSSIKFGAATHALTTALAWSGTLTFNGTATFSGAAMNGTGAVAFLASTITVTLNNTGGLTTTGTMAVPNNSITFAGSAGWTVGTLTQTVATSSKTFTLGFGNTYAVTTAFNNTGTTVSIRHALKSSSAGNKVVFTVSPGATFSLNNCDPTDVDSSGGATVISLGAVITTTLNWSNVTLAGWGSGSGIKRRSGGSVARHRISRRF